LAKYSEFVYDYIGNAYERKNLYLRDVALLQKRIGEAASEEKAGLSKDLANLTSQKESHPYNIKLKDFKEKEKVFLKGLEDRTKEFTSSLPAGLSKEGKEFRVELERAKLQKGFYKDYTDLSYDAKLKFDESNVILRLMPDIIETSERLENELSEAIKLKGTFSSEDENNAKLEIDDYVTQQKKAMETARKRLADKKANGLISSKALKNGVQELKKEYRNNVRVKSYDSPEKRNAEFIKSKRFELKDYLKVRRRIVNADIADARRNNPVEVSRTAPLYSYLSIPIPGLGQLLNGQLVKAGLFFLAALFTYIIAIPYSLGFGNYQGNGIAGLITLAEGARRIDKSLIFMIEGIIAIFLLIFAVVLIILSFRDARGVEKGIIRGIRPGNWFETRTKIGEEGFPYMVSLPALLVIVFIVLVPISTAILLSFTGMDPQNQSKFPWVGIQNYALIAGGKGLAGKVFYSIFGWTVLWTLLSTTLAIFLGFALALIANNERIKGKAFFRIVYLLPWAVPAFITIMFFSIMFSPNGILTDVIEFVFGSRFEVKNNAILTRTALIIMQGWLGSSYIFLLSTGVLQAIPEDLYEAAQIDGASAWQKTMKITVPLVLFQTAPLLVGQYTFNFNNFSIIYLFNGGGPFNPSVYGNLAGSTDILISYIYKLTMDNQYQSIGAAITIVISLGLMVFTFFGYRNSKAFKEERL